MKELLVCVPAHLTHLGNELQRAEVESYDKVPCPICERDMYIGERGKKVVADGKADAMCMECAIVLGIVDKNSKPIPLTSRDN